MPYAAPYREREDPFDQDALNRQALLQQLGQPPVDRSQPGGPDPIAISPELIARSNQGTSTQPVPNPNVPPPAPPPPPGITRDDRDRLQWGNTGTMRGFEVGSDYGGDTKARNSVKNTFGRIASRYANTAAGREALLRDEDFRRYFPNAQLGPESGRGGTIDFGGVLSDFESGVPVGIVDVLEQLDDQGNSTGWQWLDQANSGAASTGGGGGQMPGGGTSAIDALGNNDALAQILAQIQALQNGEQNPMERDILMQLLGGQG